MSTLNLESDIGEQLQVMDEQRWTALQTEICVNVANAKFYAFAEEAGHIADLVRLKVVPRRTATDYLHECATYNQLYFEYGADRIQAVMSEAFEVAA
jgi:hypothetical protein